MGGFASSLKETFSGKPRRNYRVYIGGLDGAGKTTVLYRLKLGHVVTTIPTIGFNVETVSLTHPEKKHSLSLDIWDVGGRESPHVYMRHYSPNQSAILFCVDSSDRARIAEARELLHMHDKISMEHQQGLPLLVYANKQDISGSMTAKEVEEALQLNTLKDRPYHVVGCSAVKGEGLWEGIEWVARQLNKEALSSSISSPMKETIEDGQTMLSSSSSWLSWLLCAGSKKGQQKELEEEQEFLAQRSSVTTT